MLEIVVILSLDMDRLTVLPRGCRKSTSVSSSQWWKEHCDIFPEVVGRLGDLLSDCEKAMRSSHRLWED